MVQSVPFCTSGNVQFFETANGIQATVGESPPVFVYIEGFVPTAAEGMTAAEKIKSLVESRHLWIQPSSASVSLVKPSLEEVTSLEVPSSDVFCVGRSGGIYYAYKNTLFKWDPLHQTNSPTGYQARSLSAIAELPNGELIVGDDEGSLHFPDGKKEKLFPVEIRNILLLSATRCILSTHKAKNIPACIVDLQERKVIQELKSFNPLVVEEDSFVTGSPLCLWKYEPDTGKYHIEKEFGIKEELACMASKSKVVLCIRYKAIYIVDLKTGVKSPVIADKIGAAARLQLIKFLEDEKTFFHYSGDYEGAPLTRNSLQENTHPQSIQVKGWGALSILPLKNLEVTLCVTRGNPAHLYLISNVDGTIIFDDHRSFTNNENIKEAYELPHGLILLKFSSRLLLLRLNTFVEQRYKKRTIQQGKNLSAKRAKRSESPAHLFVGEGTFSGVSAFLEKHPELAEHTTATELSDWYGGKEQNAPIDKRINKLQKKGVNVLFGINAVNLHEHFKGKRFERIHWNHPFGDPKKREDFKSVIPRFFLSCNQLQLMTDRVYVTLAQEGGLKIQRQSENPIVQGATEAGYRLVRKRHFGPTRYPGYQHNKTGKITSYVTGDESREFVFEKVGMRPQGNNLFEQARSLRDPEQKNYEIYWGDKDKPDSYYFNCSTDEDSSEYSS